MTHDVHCGLSRSNHVTSATAVAAIRQVKSLAYYCDRAVTVTVTVTVTAGPGLRPATIRVRARHGRGLSARRPGRRHGPAPEARPC